MSDDGGMSIRTQADEAKLKQSGVVLKRAPPVRAEDIVEQKLLNQKRKQRVMSEFSAQVTVT